MLASIGFFTNKNKSRKNKLRSRIARKFRKLSLAGLAFTLSFSLLGANVLAASTGGENHEDTVDYCMIVHDVTVGLQELDGISESEKEAIVESASDYYIHTWYWYNRIWGQLVNDYETDFSDVNWDQEGVYEVTVYLPAQEGLAGRLLGRIRSLIQST